MNEWELRDEEKRALRDRVRLLAPHPSADREAMMVDYACKAQGKKLVAWLGERMGARAEELTEKGGEVDTPQCYLAMEDWQALCREVIDKEVEDGVDLSGS